MLIPEAVRDLRLQPQRQDIRPRAFAGNAAPCGMRSKKSYARSSCLRSVGVSRLRVDQRLRVRQLALHPPDPKHVLVIAQAAATVLHVRLLQERRVAALV